MAHLSSALLCVNTFCHPPNILLALFWVRAIFRCYLVPNDLSKIEYWACLGLCLRRNVQPPRKSKRTRNVARKAERFICHTHYYFLSQWRHYGQPMEGHIMRICSAWGKDNMYRIWKDRKETITGPLIIFFIRLKYFLFGLWKVRFWAGGVFSAPFKSQKPHIGATNTKRHLIGR